jgi:hypothetical protein
MNKEKEKQVLLAIDKMVGYNAGDIVIITSINTGEALGTSGMLISFDAEVPENLNKEGEIHFVRDFSNPKTYCIRVPGGKDYYFYTANNFRRK